MSRKSLWIRGATIILLAQAGAAAVMSCAETPPVDGLGGSGGSGGTGGTGGTGASDGTECAEFDTDAGECGICTATLQSYCADRDCSMPSTDSLCFHHLADPRWDDMLRLVTTGCGYLRLEGWAPSVPRYEPPTLVEIWRESTEELVYHFSRSADPDACTPQIVAGTEPECAAFSEVCDSNNVCPLPPHIECLGPCFYGCIGPGQDCGSLNAACEGEGGAGGMGGGGGMGGHGP